MASFGIYYFIVKVLSSHIASPVIAIICNAVALIAIILYALFIRTTIVPEHKINTIRSLLISIPISVGLIILYLAIELGPVSVVLPIVGVNSLVAVILSVAILKERITTRKVFGVLLALSSIVLLSL